MNLTEFLTARLDEDKRRAEAMRHQSVDEPFYDCPATRMAPLGDLPWGEDACDCGLAGRKARELREVEAKRAILASYEAHVRAFGEALSAPERRNVQHLAAIYSNHPDYQQEWKP